MVDPVLLQIGAVALEDGVALTATRVSHTTSQQYHVHLGLCILLLKMLMNVLLLLPMLANRGVKTPQGRTCVCAIQATDSTVMGAHVKVCYLFFRPHPLMHFCPIEETLKIQCPNAMC